MNKRMKKSVLLITILIFVTFCAGCSNNIKQAASDENVRTIIDSAGDEITLPERIERVVSTSDPCTDMLIAFGQGDKIIGAYYRALDNPWLKEFYPAIENVTRFQSYEPESEELMAMETDIIFVPSQERAVALREKGLCAITIRYYSPEEVVGAAKLLGTIFGGSAADKSTEWIEDFNKTIELFREKTADIPEDEKPIVYEVLADKGKGLFRTYYGDNQAWLSYAGGILATKDFADATSQAMPTEEAILATDPEIIFIGGVYATDEYSNLLNDKQWANISAVKNDNIYIEPTGPTAWNACTTSYPLLIYYCFSCMYPEKVDFDLKEITHEFYQKYYGVDMTREKIDLMFQSLGPDGNEMWNGLK